MPEGNVESSSKKHPFLSSQLIAYIGNKRRLLPLIEKAVDHCFSEKDREEAPLFVDFFAGSGSVSRLAKYRGFSVVSNDWEYYSAILNRAFLETGADDLEGMFQQYGGITGVLEFLNTLEIEKDTDRYISRYYAPECTENADPDRERLFYTKENAEKIDAIRSWIDRNYSEEEKGVRLKERNLLLGLLLYEAATHANTSGVFKAYHRGFGGRGKDALGRILREIELEYPALVNGKARVTSMDAAVLAKQLSTEGRRAAIAYLDPPYNQHQYGSNYHLLNTIARNDRPEINKEIFIDGKKVAKGGIRQDWTETRSEYCYRRSAASSFRELIANIDAEKLLVSYSTEGIIPFWEMLEILGEKGRLDIVLSEYTRYRGGKQALNTTLSNVEFVLIADTQKRNRPSDTRRIFSILNEEKMRVFIKRPVSPAVFIREGFSVSASEELFRGLVFEKEMDDSSFLRVEVCNFKRIVSCALIRGEEVQPVFEADGAVQKELTALLGRVTAVSREEELSVTLNSLRYMMEKGQHATAVPILQDIPGLLRKFNDRKAYAISLDYLERSIRVFRRFCHGLERHNERRIQTLLSQMKKVVDKKLAVSSGGGFYVRKRRIRESFSSLYADAVFDR